MALTTDEFRNRVKAAAALHGRGMREARDQLEEFGADRTLAEAIISGKKPQNKRNIRDLAEAFEVPRAWFTEPDWRSLIPRTGPSEFEAKTIREQDEDEAQNLPGSPIDRRISEPERGAANS